MFKLTLIAALVAVAAAGQIRSPPKLDGRIVGGSETTIEKVRHQVSLQLYGSHFCGGSIIGEKFVVTAAHCTDGRSPSYMSVRVGSSKHASGGEVIQVAKIHQHAQYNPYDIDYDISVLELETPLTFSDSIGPIDLPKADQEPEVGSTATCTGWGSIREGGSAPANLQTVDVAIVNWDKCVEDYRGYTVTDRMICAGVPEGGKDACQGDSGGPLIVNGKLVGVVSWGYGCARQGWPGIYSNVANKSLRGHINNATGL